MEKSINIKVNEEFSMELLSHGTSGYQWFLDEYNKEILSVSIESPKTDTDMGKTPAGGMTRELLLIRGFKQGNALVSLSNRRAWEVGTAPVDTIVIEVEVG